jgi:hypothetical protein
MPDPTTPATIGRDLLNVPIGDMIRQMAFAIADAQLELDQASLQVAQLMSGTDYHVTDDDGRTTTVEGVKVHFGASDNLSMMELGFSPTFYQFVDTLIEVKIAIKTSVETTTASTSKGNQVKYAFNRRSGFAITVTPVDATYTSKYNYSAEGSSLLRTKLVPVPPPAILEERVRALMNPGT